MGLLPAETSLEPFVLVEHKLGMVMEVIPAVFKAARAETFARRSAFNSDPAVATSKTWLMRTLIVSQIMVFISSSSYSALHFRCVGSWPCCVPQQVAVSSVFGLVSRIHE